VLFRTDGSDGEPQSRYTRSRRTTRVGGSGSAAKSISVRGVRRNKPPRVDHSQAKDSEQYETVASG
jgi:hypothetical protein